MDQTHIGGVMNHYQSTGVKNHILCVLAGRFTSKQKETAQNQEKLDTKLYINLMPWFTRVSNHYGFNDVFK